MTTQSQVTSTHKLFFVEVEPSATEAMGGTAGFLHRSGKSGLQPGSIYNSKWPLYAAAV